MPMYNLIEYSENYRKTTGSLWNYYRDESNNPPADNYNADPIANYASFKYKSSITGKTPHNYNDDNITNDVEIVVPLKYLRNFWRTLDMSLITCHINPVLKWYENCILTDMTRPNVVPAQGYNRERPAISAPTNAILR